MARMELYTARRTLYTGVKVIRSGVCMEPEDGYMAIIGLSVTPVHIHAPCMQSDMQ